jgi:ribosomal protein S12 methylthiotransferase
MKQTSPRIGFVSLGCPKNLVDSERILTQLRAEGYAMSPDYAGADLVVVNTCGFIDAAVEESLGAIGDALDGNGRVIVTGCLGVREDEIRAAHPDVLAVTGPHDYEAVMAAVHAHLPAPHDPFSSLIPPQGVKLTPRHYAYLKISEGCNHRCRFCIIPSMRGDLVSRPIGEVLTEAERLVESGVRALLVVSQDTSAYGVDLKYRPDFFNGRPLPTRLTTLARELGQLQAWTRLHYVYPYPHVDDLVPMMAEGLILPYLDMPLQHGSERVLKAMRRPAATEKVLSRIARWRDTCPDLVLRSTFIVGFPGETEDDFDRLLDFIHEAQLDRVGCFAYSPVEGAAANDLPDPVPEEIKQDRLQRFMEVQAAISRDKLAVKVGSEMVVLIDAVEPGRIVARGPGDAPEVDGNVIIDGEWDDVAAGDFIEVMVTGYDDHDLFAEPTE